MLTPHEIEQLRRTLDNAALVGSQSVAVINHLEARWLRDLMDHQRPPLTEVKP